VTSPTSMQVTIPGSWQSTPTQTALHVQSNQYPALVSQALDFEIGDGSTFTQTYSGPTAPAPRDLESMITDRFAPPRAPAPLLISSVGDGFVPLAASDATQPTAVTLQGAGFQPGNTVVVSVDGFQTPLSPNSVADNQVQLQLPPSLFKLRAYTFDFQINLQNAIPGQHPPHAQQLNNSGKVIFKNQPAYAVGATMLEQGSRGHWAARIATARDKSDLRPG
jgi:hypothetical protein